MAIESLALSHKPGRLRGKADRKQDKGYYNWLIKQILPDATAIIRPDHIMVIWNNKSYPIRLKSLSEENLKKKLKDIKLSSLISPESPTTSL